LSTADLRNYWTEFQICGKGGQSHIFGGSKGVGVTIESYGYRTMLNFYPPFLCRVLEAILKMADILKILKMQNCSKFDMWVNNDVPNWFLTLKNF
jgi:hypothetical protein